MNDASKTDFSCWVRINALELDVQFALPSVSFRSEQPLVKRESSRRSIYVERSAC